MKGLFEMAKAHKFLQGSSMTIALEQTIAVGVAYLVGFWFGRAIHSPLAFVSGLWCSISTILVLQAEIGESIKQGWIRLVGSIAGSIISLIVASIFGYHFWSFLVSIFLTIIFVSLINFKEAIRISALTVAVIMITGLSHPHISAWLNSLSRLAESTIGAVIAMIFVWLFSPLYRWIMRIQK